MDELMECGVNLNELLIKMNEIHATLGKIGMVLTMTMVVMVLCTMSIIRAIDKAVER